MKQLMTGVFTCLALTACTSLQSQLKQTSQRQAEETLARMVKIADWQLANPSRHPPLDWTLGAFYPGLLALDGLQADAKYREAVRKVGEASRWANGPHTYHADDYAVAQSFAELYVRSRERAFLAPSVKQFDFILAHPSDGPADQIRFGHSKTAAGLATPMRWWWCDSLFMAPGAWARVYAATGEAKYLDFLVKEWQATSAILYDREEHLFYRDNRYFPTVKREANGKKIFWGRGNGWVVAGLVRVLEVLPENHPARPFFVNQFKEMCAKLLSIQPTDGVWRASLLDPASYPIQETSGTGFICYALAWGLNQGLLDRAATEPALRKAYQALTTFVTPEGKLTHVQPIGADPKSFDVNGTEVYGVGAYLLASTEMYRMDLLAAKPHAEFTAANSSSQFLPQQTVEIPWSYVTEKMPEADAATLAVMDAATSRFLITQIVWSPNGKYPAALLFQTDLLPNQTQRFILVGDMNLKKLPQPVLSTMARFVPERLDDFAWESDCAAYRAYGPALWKQDGAKDGKPAKTGNGIDIWGKRDRTPAVNRMFKEKNYHSPSLGYGIDCYKVGTGPGCGGSAIRKSNGQYVQPITYQQWKLFASGPIRASFALTYAPVTVDKPGEYVAEIRYFSIDLGSPFFKVTSVYSDEVTPACGLSWRPADAASGVAGKGWAACWEPADMKVPAQMGIALIVPDGSEPSAPAEEARWISGKPGEQLTAYAGGTWSGGQDAHNAAEWFALVKTFRERLNARIVIR